MNFYELTEELRIAMNESFKLRFSNCDVYQFYEEERPFCWFMLSLQAPARWYIDILLSEILHHLSAGSRDAYKT